MSSQSVALPPSTISSHQEYDPGLFNLVVYTVFGGIIGSILDAGERAMCGRMDVDADMLNRWVPEILGLSFSTVTNHDLRPTQRIDTLALVNGRLSQLGATWGIKPSWATSLLINAKCETVRSKQTFVKSYVQRRCLVPCSGFYEWRAELNGKKKYRFTAINQRPLYMAAFWYPGEMPQIVTLTRDAPSLGTRAIHTRFPVFIRAEDAEIYVLGSADEADEVLGAAGDSGIEVMPARPD